MLPSYREGLSRSLLEAGAYGRAIITADAPGGRDLVQNLVNGLLVFVQDSNSLAQAMSMMALDHKLRRKLAKQMHEDIVKKYDSKIITKKMLTYYP